jgi:hypothetical protein
LETSSSLHGLITLSSDKEGQKMTDTAQSITGLHPPWNLPTIFVDNVANLARGSGIVKFYFTRFDPAISGNANAQPSAAPVCQVVMPKEGFVAMTMFFQQQLEIMIQKNEIPREFVDQIKGLAAQPAAPQTSQPQ